MKGAAGAAYSMSYLVIVESPAKANTIKGYLGSKYKVIASKGHIRDLPKSALGIDIDGGFKPHYINIRGKGDVIKELKKEAKNAEKVFLATDPDREGEAISWHIATELGLNLEEKCRITFNETTKSAVKAAIKTPRKIDMDLVNSQQARRILDRVVGFKLSELLWKNLKGGLSGGRVQSVAARIITEREEEIRAFAPQEYWTIDTELKASHGEAVKFKFFGRKNKKMRLSCEADAEKVYSELLGGSFEVVSVRNMDRQKTPPAPFTTSTLQQEASKRLGFQSQKIMKVAQELYEGLNLGSELGGVQGLITYMRTDSLRISAVAQEAAKAYISREYGEELLPASERVYKGAVNSQDAHEAIRPSNIELTPQLVKSKLSPDQFKLYKLIWERFVASQMANAVLSTVSIEVENSGYIFKASGYIVKVKGYLSVYAEEDTSLGEEEDVNLSKLPEVKKGDGLIVNSLSKSQHFTEPPMRYTEASLIKFLEENGIGRPSTYAPIISILTARKYVERDGKSLRATSLGEVTVNYMKDNFPEIIDYEFTASMEGKLDSIAHSENTVDGVLNDFYSTFSAELEKAKSSVKREVKIKNDDELSDVSCERCGATMIYKEGRYGRFLACPNFPNCKFTLTLDKDGKPAKKEEQTYTPAGFKCDICGAEMVIRRGRYGDFYACANYPECKNSKQKVLKIGVKCPSCALDLVAKRSRGKTVFYTCENHPECNFSSWDMPLNENCPDCGQILFYRKSRTAVICKNPSCDYKRDEEIKVSYEP